MYVLQNEGSNIEAFHSNIFIFPFLRKVLTIFHLTNMILILIYIDIQT